LHFSFLLSALPLFPRLLPTGLNYMCMFQVTINK